MEPSRVPSALASPTRYDGGDTLRGDALVLPRQVFQWAGERPPDISCPLDCYSDRGALTSYPTAPSDGGLGAAPEDGGSGIGPQSVVPTVSVQVRKNLPRYERHDYRFRNRESHAGLHARLWCLSRQVLECRVGCFLLGGRALVLAAPFFLEGDVWHEAAVDETPRSRSILDFLSCPPIPAISPPVVFLPPSVR